MNNVPDLLLTGGEWRAVDAIMTVRNNNKFYRGVGSKMSQ
jgi:hypothetical protein